MRKWTVSIAATAAMLFIFVLGGVHGDIDSSAPGAGILTGGTANAATAICPVPSLATVSGEWVVRSARCTGAACRRAHLAAGDRIRFVRDISGEANFSVDFMPAATGRRAKSDGYTLRSDGVSGLKGSITLDHDALDGSPLDLHWLIVQFRSYGDDGFGSCKVSGQVQICDTEPAAGATTCDAKQHGGVIVVDPP